MAQSPTNETAASTPDGRHMGNCFDDLRRHMGKRFDDMQARRDKQYKVKLVVMGVGFSAVCGLIVLLAHSDGGAASGSRAAPLTAAPCARMGAWR